jgi:hypothetical protein
MLHSAATLQRHRLRTVDEHARHVVRKTPVHGRENAPLHRARSFLTAAAPAAAAR